MFEGMGLPWPFRRRVRWRLEFCHRGSFGWGGVEPSPWFKTHEEVFAWRDAQETRYAIRECNYISWESWAHNPHWVAVSSERRRW